MALNFSHPTIFPAHLPEDNLGSPFMIGNSCLMEDSQESVSKDILDLLPADPFGMDMSFTAAIKGFLEDFDVDCGFGNAEVGVNRVDCPLFVGWNLIWNNALGFGSYSGIPALADKRASDSGISSHYGMSGNIYSKGDAISNKVLGDAPCHGASYIVRNVGDASSSKEYDGHSHKDEGVNATVEDETPHSAFVFALGYLGVCDLLSVERVCKSLRCIVQNDPLLWRNIHIDQRLSERITDDSLLQLTHRAQGKLQSLNLMECTKITDDGLKLVLEDNLNLAKLGVSGCTRLTIDGVLSCLKTFNSIAMPGIKHLRISGLYGINKTHFEDFKTLLGVNNQTTTNSRKPHFYRRGNLCLSIEDERAIDIEECPKCQNLRLLYNCPVEEHSGDNCRACILCVPRCVDCGRCINDGEFEETFCLELLCSVCGEQSLDLQAKEEMVTSSLYQETSTHFTFQGSLYQETPTTHFTFQG